MAVVVRTVKEVDEEEKVEVEVEGVEAVVEAVTAAEAAVAVVAAAEEEEAEEKQARCHSKTEELTTVRAERPKSRRVRDELVAAKRRANGRREHRLQGGHGGGRRSHNVSDLASHVPSSNA